MGNIRWRALGVTWSLEYDNECAVQEAAERLAAMLQVLQADLARHDLALLPTNVSMRLKTEDGAEANAVLRTENGKTWWEVTLPLFSSELDVPAASLQALSVGMSLLLYASMLPHDEVRLIIEDSIRSGMTHKVAPARVYDELVETFTPCEEDAAVLRNMPPLASGSEFALSEHDQLAWRGGPGPNYTAEEAAEGIRRRCCF